MTERTEGVNMSRLTLRSSGTPSEVNKTL